MTTRNHGWLRLGILGMGVCAAHPSHADEVPQIPLPESAERGPDIDDDTDKWRASSSMGVAWFSATGGPSHLDSSDNVGLAFQGVAGRSVGSGWYANFGFGMGVTEFSRTMDLWEKAGAAGRWTTNAYKDVYDWAESDGDNDDTASLRQLGSIFAYFGLVFAYMYSGLLYVLGPMYSVSFMEIDLTATQHFGDDGRGPYVGGGLALLTFVHPTAPTSSSQLMDTQTYGPTLRTGVGMVVTSGTDLGPVSVGAKVIYSPSSWHNDLGVEGTNVMTATATIGLVR